ncbi:MAG: hypothetical protein VX899_26495 [Myxococcota bacterium]|nr:hypothetical protein [Myxococcota bacterium]
MNAWILTVGLALAQDQSDRAAQTASYEDGYRLGWSYAATVPTLEWAAYGAAGSCLFGGAGCVGVTALGYYVDPEDLPPLQLDADYNIPQAYMGSTHPAPEGTLYPEHFAEGYEDGWDARVRRSRARWAFAGGAAVPVVITGAYVGLFAGSLVWSTL